MKVRSNKNVFDREMQCFMFSKDTPCSRTMGIVAEYIKLTVNIYKSSIWQNCIYKHGDFSLNRHFMEIFKLISDA